MNLQVVVMPGRRYSDGLHQAIEAKEGVEVKRESRTLATITPQNFFNKYNKTAGMTGTALTEEEEFREIYGLMLSRSLRIRRLFVWIMMILYSVQTEREDQCHCRRNH